MSTDASGARPASTTGGSVCPAACDRLGDSCDCFQRRRLCCYDRPCARRTAFIVVFVVAWNFVKLPFFLDPSLWPATHLTYDSSKCTIGDPSYWCRGAEVSVTVGWWTDWEYRAGKLFGDPVIFFAAHIIMGSTVLIMSAIVLVWPKFQRPLAPYFFTLSLLFSAHIYPVLPNRRPFTFYVFTADVVAVNAVCVVGLAGLYFWDRLGPHAYRLMTACYWLICFGAMGAAYAEFGLSLIPNWVLYFWNGKFPMPEPFEPEKMPDDADKPSKFSGHAGYSEYPSLRPVAYALIVLWIVVVWFGGFLMSQGVIARPRCCESEKKSPAQPAPTAAETKKTD